MGDVSESLSSEATWYESHAYIEGRLAERAVQNLPEQISVYDDKPKHEDWTGSDSKDVEEAAEKCASQGGPFSIHFQNYAYMFEQGVTWANQQTSVQVPALVWKKIEMDNLPIEPVLVLSPDATIIEIGMVEHGGKSGTFRTKEKWRLCTNYINLQDLLNLSRE